MAEENLTPNTEPDLSQPIDAKQAVRRARDYLLELYEGEDLPNLRLEEVVRSENGLQWLITLGFTGTEQEFEHAGFLKSVSGKTVRPRREYKLITIDAYSGEPESMTIREV